MSILRVALSKGMCTQPHLFSEAAHIPTGEASGADQLLMKTCESPFLCRTLFMTIHRSQTLVRRTRKLLPRVQHPHFTADVHKCQYCGVDGWMDG